MGPCDNCGYENRVIGTTWEGGVEGGVSLDPFLLCVVVHMQGELGSSNSLMSCCNRCGGQTLSTG